MKAEVETQECFVRANHAREILAVLASFQDSEIGILYADIPGWPRSDEGYLAIEAKRKEPGNAAPPDRPVPLTPPLPAGSSLLVHFRFPTPATRFR
jgi:hypothetical protein